jgi:hypothetical protein
MDEKTLPTTVCSQVRPTQADPPAFFYEIWQDTGDGNRWQIKISREFPTAEAAQKACDDEARWYIAERLPQPRPSTPDTAKLTAMALMAARDYSPEMKGYAFVFKSMGDRPVLAYTGDLSGAILPADLGPWEFTGGSPLEGRAFEAIRAGIEARGFYVTGTDPAT